MTKKTILIADDEPNVLELIKDCLGDEYNFLEAKDGEEVLNIVKKRTPDLILLDIMMPKIDGFEVCRRLRMNSTTKDITIAMVSAKKEEEDILEGVDLGAIAYITKPFSPMELKEKVEELLMIGK